MLSGTDFWNIGSDYPEQVNKALKLLISFCIFDVTGLREQALSACVNISELNYTSKLNREPTLGYIFLFFSNIGDCSSAKQHHSSESYH